MSHASYLILPIAAAFAASLAAQDAQLTPRELFYKPVHTVQNPPAKKPAGLPQSPVNTTQRPPAPLPEREQARANAPDGTPIVAASQRPALGIKYAIVKRAGSEQVEVPQDTVFRTGDAIQLKVETNLPGYLYVVNQGSSGTWRPMFPAPELANGNNHVDGFQPVILPSSRDQMTFRDPSGTENLFIVFSRDPIPDFEELIYSLKGKPSNKKIQQPEAPPKDNKVIVAQVSIDDATIGRLRSSVRTRDLIIEPVTPTTSDSTQKKETATYVVNAATATGSSTRVVADLHLRHQ